MKLEISHGQLCDLDHRGKAALVKAVSKELVESIEEVSCGPTLYPVSLAYNTQQPVYRRASTSDQGALGKL